VHTNKSSAGYVRGGLRQRHHARRRLLGRPGESCCGGGGCALGTWSGSRLLGDCCMVAKVVGCASCRGCKAERGVLVAAMGGAITASAP